ncbi:hypothetical protein EJ08DRAFT_126011 [Tothia fuscella]|uniref:Ribosomal RNA methyltransferase FtsJ domain-containing protein n=1 Tax=Tothia fuscella TaxID=1048955 RepID=A0A9P4TZL7_9PEZI|nr:hypothetical protein EJ08DRAFT_126011 [Tothia fuscella]
MTLKASSTYPTAIPSWPDMMKDKLLGVYQEGQEERNNQKFQTPGPHVESNRMVKEWFLQNSDVFVHLWKMKLEGWQIPQNVWESLKAKHLDASEISEQCHDGFKTSFRTLEKQESIIPQGHGKRMLDICMAPGGFAFEARKENHNLKICAFTLHHDDGGFPIHDSIQYDYTMGDNEWIEGNTEEKHWNANAMRGEKVKLRFTNVTNLIDEFVDEKNPVQGPVPKKFERGNDMFTEHKFDLVIGDGHIIDGPSEKDKKNTEITKPKPKIYDLPEDIEYYRLTAAEVVIGLSRIAHGGTFVLVPMAHESNAWETFKLITALMQFSTVTFFKPENLHQAKSSFYIIAKNVQSESSECKELVERWKRIWRWATFYGPNNQDINTNILQAVENDNKKGDVAKELATNGPIVRDCVLGIMLTQMNGLHSKYMRALKKMAGGTEDSATQATEPVVP